MVDNSGNIVAKYEYSPFGKITASSGAYVETNPFRFSSEYFDSETSLVYYNYRYYNPVLGRWLSRDPIAESGGWNLYEMTDNNSVDNWDRLGFLCDDEKEVNRGLSWLDKLQLTLDGIGLIPAAGNFADGGNVIISSIRGNWTDAGLSAMAMIPIIGQAATAGKIATKASKIVKVSSKINKSKNFKHVVKILGVNKKQASKALHAAKKAAGHGGADNVIFDTQTGDIISKSGEVIGNLFD